MVLELGKSIDDECVGDRTEAGVSYAEQWEDLFSRPLQTSKPVPKPSNAAQSQQKGAVQVPFSNVWGTLMRGARGREWTETDIGRTAWFTLMHGIGLFAFLPRFFSWPMVTFQFLLYCASGMGITYSYHRQLAHKSFKSPKWLEYLASTCGMMAFQGSPYEWVSDQYARAHSHPATGTHVTHNRVPPSSFFIPFARRSRYHHLHTETPLDPHSSYEGFYWSHLGWMLDSKLYKERCGDNSNVQDLWKQPWYRFTHNNYITFMLSHFALMYAIGGTAALVWRCFFTALLYHVTWFVNSASHLWGRQEYKTGDQSRNNWWVGWLAFGEGWHNNHHAFEYSARHGLRPRQFDITYAIINLLRRVGLVHSVKLPTAAARKRLAIDPEAIYIEPEAA